MTWAQAFDGVFADWFRGETWQPWKAVGKALFNEPLTPDELVEFQQFTGRTLAPTTPARQIWLLVGRRAGKDWFSAAVCVYIACYRKHSKIKVGDLWRVFLLAVTKDQAQECFRYVGALIDSRPDLKAMVQKRSNRRDELYIRLKNQIEICVTPANQRSIRGRTVLAAVCSEISHWWDDESNANPATDIIRALRPSMLGVPGALMMAVSSPWGRFGITYDTYSQHWGQDGDPVLVWQASTMAMRPDKSDEFLSFLEEELKNDPIAFDNEYRAQFRKDLELFINREQIEAVIVAGRPLTPWTSGPRFYAFFDAAGGSGQDSATLAIAAYTGGKARLVALYEWRPPFSPTAVAKEVARILEQYRIRSLRGDNYSGGTWSDILRHAGVGHYDVSESTCSEIYRDLIPLLNSRLVELPDPACSATVDRMVKQLVALERSVTKQGREVITHATRGHDDLINSCAGALVNAMEKGRRSGSIGDPRLATVHGTDYSVASGRGGRVIDGKGTMHMGGDTFRTAKGETFHDPRGV